MELAKFQLLACLLVQHIIRKSWSLVGVSELRKSWLTDNNSPPHCSTVLNLGFPMYCICLSLNLFAFPLRISRRRRDFYCSNLLLLQSPMNSTGIITIAVLECNPPCCKLLALYALIRREKKLLNRMDTLLALLSFREFIESTLTSLHTHTRVRTIFNHCKSLTLVVDFEGGVVLEQIRTKNCIGSRRRRISSLMKGKTR